MEIYFLRHGMAENLDPFHHHCDQDRSLTSKGRDLMQQEALGMKALGIRFDLILSSPYLRAQQTAEIVAKELNYQGVIYACDHLKPTSNLKELLRELENNYANSSHLLLTSHEPFVSNAVARLTSHSMPSIEPGGLCHLVWKGAEREPVAYLERYYRPEDLTKQIGLRGNAKSVQKGLADLRGQLDKL